MPAQPIEATSDPREKQAPLASPTSWGVSMNVGQAEFEARTTVRSAPIRELLRREGRIREVDDDLFAVVAESILRDGDAVAGSDLSGVDRGKMGSDVSQVGRRRRR